jgi:hypothetical protein
MPVFHVYLNGKKVAIAGVGKLGVLSAGVTWCRRKGEHTRAKKPHSTEEELTLQVAGLITPTEEDVWWQNRMLKIGDEVHIRVVENGRVDKPSSRKRRDRKKDLRAQKRYVREMAKKFGWKLMRDRAGDR